MHRSIPGGERLAVFIRGEISKRKVSLNEFARQSGIAASTLSQLTHAKGIPTLDTLYRLSKYTMTPLTALLDLMYPGEGFAAPAEAQALAVRFAKLSQKIRDTILVLVSAFEDE